MLIANGQDFCFFVSIDKESRYIISYDEARFHDSTYRQVKTKTQVLVTDLGCSGSDGLTGGERF